MIEKYKKLKTAKAVDSSSDDEKGVVKNCTTSSSDDEDANADLTLEIIKKAQLLAARNNSREDVSQIVTDDKRKKEKKRNKKCNGVEIAEAAVTSEVDTGFRDFCVDLFMVDNVKNEEKLEADKTIEDTAIVSNPGDVADSAVMRKLLRGPRYFDPPGNSWGSCYNCGEDGHISVNCTSAKRKKPCFVCGSFEHNAKECSKGRDCYICKQQGHRAKTCPEKNKISKMCLKCGDLGHDMFMCRNEYLPDDLKDIQCYICKKFGHLCCVNYSDPGPRVVSCYRCGLSGHTGLACAGYQTDVNFSGSANSCYKCGVEGHFARECTSSTKTKKRNRELSTPKVKSVKKNRDNMEVRSAPHDLGKTNKKKRTQYGEFTPPVKAKHRGGWITDDPGEFLSSKGKQNNWRSPATPKNRVYKISSRNNNYATSSHPPKKHYMPKFTDSASHGSSRYYQHRFSDSRYSYSSNDWSGRNYSRW